MSNEELNELARWAGLRRIGKADVWWVDAKGRFCFDDPPPFPSSLDACFKYLVPKVSNIELRGQFGRYTVCVFDEETSDWYHSPLEVETPALALCLAIEQLINKETQ